MVNYIEKGVTYWMVRPDCYDFAPPRPPVFHTALHSFHATNPEVWFETQAEAWAVYRDEYAAHVAYSRAIYDRAVAEFAAIFPEPPQPTVTRQRAISGPSHRSK